MHHQDAGSVSARLRRAVRVSGMSRYELSRQADVSQSSLSRFVRGVGGISVDNLERVVEALGLEVVIREREEQAAGPQ
jgi:transcriptional regulator with XRE-family HTH domain